ncbi:MAG: hypothetical protein JXR51_09170 [Bacteroidales bacterium]|nr:hypothetical protein [Bacteroidales bacterium]MBN2757334.1 hypothetical protein [Bacteroidales bacterium]
MFEKLSFFFWKLFNKKYINSKKQFISISKTGFEVINLLGDTLYLYKWEDIEDIYFEDENHDNLIIVDSKNVSISYPKSTINWIHFLKTVPQNFKSLDYEHIANYLKSLKYCEICGYKAVDEYCDVCSAETWDDKFLEDYESKEEYLKEEQLDYYAVMSIYEHVDFEQDKDLGFEKDINYKIYVSKEEILKHSAEFYYD